MATQAQIESDRREQMAKRVAEIKAGRPDLVREWLSDYEKRGGDREEMRQMINKYWKR